MTTKDDGGPAFASKRPRPNWTGDESCAIEHVPGMTLRQWYAGMALSSMALAPEYSKGADNASVAIRAFRIADEMILEGNRK